MSYEDTMDDIQSYAGFDGDYEEYEGDCCPMCGSKGNFSYEYDYEGYSKKDKDKDDCCDCCDCDKKHDECDWCKERDCDKKCDCDRKHDECDWCKECGRCKECGKSKGDDHCKECGKPKPKPKMKHCSVTERSRKVQCECEYKVICRRKSFEPTMKVTRCYPKPGGPSRPGDKKDK